MRYQGIIGSALASAFLLAGATGCAQKKLTECNALITVINGGVQALEKAPKHEDDPTGVKDLEAMAVAMEKVAADASNIQITLPELKDLAGKYQKMAKDIAKAERDLALAAQDRSADKRAVAEKVLDAAVKQEDPLVEGINKFCETP